MLKPKAGGNNSDTLGSTSSPGPTFADVEGSDPKRQRTCSSSLRAAKVVEINESLARVASQANQCFLKNFPFVDFIYKEFMTSAFKNQVKDINLVGSIQWAKRCLLKMTAICQYAEPLIMVGYKTQEDI